MPKLSKSSVNPQQQADVPAGGIRKRPLTRRAAKQALGDLALKIGTPHWLDPKVPPYLKDLSREIVTNEETFESFLDQVRNAVEDLAIDVHNQPYLYKNIAALKKLLQELATNVSVQLVSFLGDSHVPKGDSNSFAEAFGDPDVFAALLGLIKRHGISVYVNRMWSQEQIKAILEAGAGQDLRRQRAAFATITAWGILSGHDLAEMDAESLTLLEQFSKQATICNLKLARCASKCPVTPVVAGILARNITDCLEWDGTSNDPECPNALSFEGVANTLAASGNTSVKQIILLNAPSADCLALEPIIKQARNQGITIMVETASLTMEAFDELVSKLKDMMAEAGGPVALNIKKCHHANAYTEKQVAISTTEAGGPVMVETIIPRD